MSSKVVALVNDIAGVGGGPGVTLATARALRELAYEAVVVSPSGPLAEQAIAEGIAWREFEFTNRRLLTKRTRVPRPSALQQRRIEARQLDRLLADIGASVLHTGALVPHVVSFFVRRRGPIVWHLNQVHPHLLFAGRSPTRILAVSQAALAPARWRKKLRKRSVVVPNGIDLDRFSPLTDEQRRAARNQFGLPTDRPLVVTVARLEPAKGVHRLIEIVAGCHAAPVLAVAGGPPLGDDGAYAADLHGLAERHDVDVRFLGERNDVECLIAAADVFAFASTWEAFGLVLAEAAACGIPVVSSPAGGCREIVQPSVTGMLVDPDDKGGFARAIDELLADEGRRRSMGEQARSHAEEQFDIRRYPQALERVYSTLISEAR